MGNVIKYFIDIDDQRAFDGSSPYIHWFEDKQSINLIYIKRLCFALEEGEDVYIKIPSNNIFHILTDPSTWSDENIIDHFEYKDLSQHTVVDDTYYQLTTTAWNDVNLACCYILASSPVSLEARENLYLRQGDKEETIIVGADFYEEREELSINISNQGTSLPETIQRAVYDSNVHEEAKDNILMNRKYKELLMDYMNILGARGSYSSLINSLNWFGYGDNIKLKEFWRHHLDGTDILEENEISSVISNKLSSMLSKYAKTTYCGIFYACQQTNGYEKESTFLNNGSGFLAEPNPDLQNLSLKWSKEDMSIKMALLGNFFETYFMPVHLDLIASTLENVVYTNTMKIVSSGDITREDYILQDSQMTCSIKDGDIFLLQNIHTNADNKTCLVNKYQDGDTYSSYTPVGVKDSSATGYQKNYQSTIFKNLLEDDNILVESDFLYSGNQSKLSTAATIDDIVDIKSSRSALEYDATQVIRTNGGAEITDKNVDDEIKTILLNNYHGPGCIVPFQFILPCVSGDVVYKEEICLFNESLNKHERREFNNLFYAERDNIYDSTEKYTIRIVFNMLFTQDKSYDIAVRFFCNSGQVFTKTVHFRVVDTAGSTINLYKIKHNSLVTEGETTRRSNDFMFGRTRHSYQQHKDLTLHSDIDEYHAYYAQYLPVDTTSDQNNSSIKLKEIIVTRAAWKNSLNKIISIEEVIDNVLATWYYRLYHDQILKLQETVGKEDSIRLQYAALLSNYLNADWLFSCEGDSTTIKNTLLENAEKLKEVDIYNLYNSLSYGGYSCDHTAEEIKDIIFDEEYSGARYKYFIENLIGEGLVNYIDPDVETENFDINDEILLCEGSLKAWLYLCKNYTRYTRGEGENKYYIWVPKSYTIQDKKLYKNTTSSRILAELVNQPCWYSKSMWTWYEKNDLDRILPETSGLINDRMTLYKKDNAIITDSKYECSNFINRKEFIYFPEDHCLVPLDRTQVETLRVTPGEILAVVPNISYSQHITSFEWDFYNKSTLQHVYMGGLGDEGYNREPSISIKEPFIAAQSKKRLPAGYYDVIFRYKLSPCNDNIHEISLNGAFIQVSSK